METTTTALFDDIRPLHDSEVAETIAALIDDPWFRRAAETFIQPFTWEQFTVALSACKTKENFQHSIIYPVMKQLIGKTTAEMKGFGWEKIDHHAGGLFISNHRDIVLDAAFLNILMFDQVRPTTEIAIGDNLLIYPWIEKLVRLNKSFIVKRGVSVRQMLQVSKHLSDYIHDTVTRRNQAVWIAQREGRAKDSDDRTQASLLKMLTLHNSARPLETLKQLHITPLAISYEIDPCDYLKAREYQLKRDHADYRKTNADDLENMITGIMGYKGRVHFRFGDGINPQLDNIPADTPKNELVEKVAAIIDQEIYRHYSFFPFNYVAYDMMTGERRFAQEYSEEDRVRFEAYLQKQIEKIKIPGRDDVFLRKKMVMMYGNTVKNSLSVP
ncbi:MAG: 1-acyl-sn-glycerol-3-phosphate acyltransferase [Proteiniphilum sp.]|nr:1-acyl-sn-glycerol-3-phosphate acyltransferase [Proteiniphilum sp.]